MAQSYPLGWEKSQETIVDLGAGSGYFSFRFAKVRPRGKVVAVDTQAEMVRHIHHGAMREGIPNVEARVAAPDDPKLPAGADVVFLCDVLHHVQQRPQWLETLHTQMSSGARLVLIEFKAGKLPEGSPEAVKIPKDRLNALVREAGFRLQRDTPGLLPYQEFLTFVKP
jgi:ubiquinone/menaquinone biosynthesis C-methylase UbiE